jgi:hypothetical protein
MSQGVKKISGEKNWRRKKLTAKKIGGEKIRQRKKI